jgi:hypothetical protein
MCTLDGRLEDEDAMAAEKGEEVRASRNAEL